MNNEEQNDKVENINVQPLSINNIFDKYINWRFCFNKLLEV